MDGLQLTEIDDRAAERLDCAYLQADLALHSPQNKWKVTNSKIRVNLLSSLWINFFSIFGNIEQNRIL